MSKLKFGVIGTSKKEDEKRFPIHPEHLTRIPEQIRHQLIFEEGYGDSFGIKDSEIASKTGGIATRHELLVNIGQVIIPKPVLSDLQELREGGILWGWPHCVQQRDITQAAIDRKQTLIAFEDMFVWGPDGQIGRHTFYKNNEIAGYCAVLHALQLKGIDGYYGKQRKVLVFGFGAVSHGAIYALKAHGFRDITVCTQGPDFVVREEIPGCNYVYIREGNENEARMIMIENSSTVSPLIDKISQSDIIVNGTFQEPNHPILFVTEDEKSNFKPNSLIIDISCDEGMGFYFAKPTSFKNPMFKSGVVDYYAVDHTPSYLWESASQCISEVLIPHLPTIVAGRKSWQQNETIRQAINIEDGVIQKPAILAFQKRQAIFPHPPIDTEKN